MAIPQISHSQSQCVAWRITSIYSQAVNRVRNIFQIIHHPTSKYVWINFTDDAYECALVDFSCTTTNFQSPLEEIYICLNIVSEQLIGGSRRRLVRRTTVKCARYQMEKFQLPFYVPIKPVASNMLEVYIKGADGKEISFLKNITTCTFHLRRKKKLSLTT